MYALATHRAEWDRPVPRYTSYPTAAQFHAGVGVAAYRQWLAGVDPAEPISLYLHVPYCQQLCRYCGCHMRVARRYGQVQAYVEPLAAEIDLVAAALPGRLKVGHIHWGGGTPTILSPEDFMALQGRLRTRFEILDGAEIAVECDPRVLGAPLISAMAAAGVTRASLGVQDFDVEVQRAIGRWQPYELTLSAVEGLRRAGIRQINLDLMYGLPRQTVDSILATVDRAAGLDPDRLALFGYAHVPWMKPHQRLMPEAELPDGEARLAQAAAAAERLQQLGYVWIGLDHFARPEDPMAIAAARGRLHRNFQGYATDPATTLLGFGASAIGALDQGYVQNEVDIRAWRTAIAAGSLATRRGVALEEDDRLRRHVIERLMCDLEVDLEAAAARFGRDKRCFESEWGEIRRLAEEGLVEIDGETFRLTAAGRPFMRLAACVFDRYFDPGAGRHAKAV